MKKLSKQMKALILFIDRYQKRHNYRPSLEDIADKFGVSKQAIAKRLLVVAEKGAIKIPKDRRSWYIVKNNLTE